MEHESYFRGTKWVGVWTETKVYRDIEPVAPSVGENIVLVDEETLIEAQHCVSGCEHCAENASIAFDYLLDAITGCDPTVTDYVMCRPARCPGCSHSLTEKTRVVAS